MVNQKFCNIFVNDFFYSSGYEKNKHKFQSRANRVALSEAIYREFFDTRMKLVIVLPSENLKLPSPLDGREGKR